MSYVARGSVNEIFLAFVFVSLDDLSLASFLPRHDGGDYFVPIGAGQLGSEMGSCESV